jgi:SAM-dependent MidA family methyltransferase
MDCDTRAVLVQACHNSGANTTRGTCDQKNLVVECLYWHAIIHKDFIANMQYEPSASLPKPDALSAEHSARVREHVRARIDRAGGQISFAEYMQEVLYAPGLGYYSAGTTKFGTAGDFITAPEVSSVFGIVLARQVAEVLQDINDGSILELGAGSGKLAVDMLTALERSNSLPVAYHILEVSPDLQARQKQRILSALPHLNDRVHWISALPQDFEGVVVANEVLDALPVERFVRQQHAILQSCVAAEGHDFLWSTAPAPERLQSAIAAIEADLGETLADGYTSEVSLAAPLLIGDLAKSLKRGAAFFFDYGVSQHEYYATDRSDGWLRCHYRHHAHNNPFIYPGIQDLTTWVDFSTIASAAVANDFDLLGYQTQSQFLMGGGLEREMQGFAELPIKSQLELSGQIKTLTLPGEMGENFKCIALGCGDIRSPSAFHFADRTRSL